MGRIAAGTPIEAIQTRSHTINMPPDLLTAGEHFALEVRGNSMIEAGILDGDIALLKRSDTANTGDIVVALIDDEEATLKRFRRRGASIALEPAKPLTRCASCRPIACVFRASSWVCSGDIDSPPSFRGRALARSPESITTVFAERRSAQRQFRATRGYGFRAHAFGAPARLCAASKTG